MADRESLDASCVKNLVFNLLLNSEDNYDYPDLQEDAVDNISGNLADVICGVLRQKSVASSARRTNILRFLNLTCQAKESHLEKDCYKIYIQQLKEEQTSNPKSQKLQDFLDKNKNELDSIVPDNFGDDVLKYYERKNIKKKEKSLKLEYIKSMDQEKLNTSNLQNLQVSKHFSHYETNEELIRQLLDIKDPKDSEDNPQKGIENDKNGMAYREKQIKFCYALLNIGDLEDLTILNAVLETLSRYKCLERFEINFLNHLWISEKEKAAQFSSYVLDNFPFVVEKAVLKFSTEVLKLGNDDSEFL